MVPTRYTDRLFEEITTHEDIPFRTARNERGEDEVLRLDVYLPAGDTEQQRPAILWIHGGGFAPPITKHQAYIGRMVREFAARGYACFACDYRVRQSPFEDIRGTIREALEDCRAALDWVWANAASYGADPGHIAVGGGSAGGILGVVLCALESAGADRAGGPFALVDLWGSPRPEMMLAPIGSEFPPTVIVHGTADEIAPYEHSEALARTLEAEGVRCLLHTIPGAPHTPVTHLEEFVPVVAGFLHAALPGK